MAEVDVGLVVPREARALTAAMATFLADPVRRKTASTRAREMMAKRYDWRAIAVRMAALYSGDTA